MLYIYISSRLFTAQANHPYVLDDYGINEQLRLDGWGLEIFGIVYLTQLLQLQVPMIKQIYV